MRVFLAIFLAALALRGAQAADHPCASGIAKTGTVETVSNKGNWFSLTGSPHKYALADLAMAHLTETTVSPSDELTLFPVKNASDRYGRILVYGWKEGRWLQGRMLERGDAFAFPLSASKACRLALFEKEKAGETNKRGIWKDNKENLAADDLSSLLKKAGHFTLVSGKVLSVGNRKRRIYLNFGQKWSQDFTVSVAKKGSGAFNGDVNALLKLKNKTIRVRGMLEEQQGPLIRVIHEAQLEIID